MTRRGGKSHFRSHPVMRARKAIGRALLHIAARQQQELALRRQSGACTRGEYFALPGHTGERDGSPILRYSAARVSPDGTIDYSVTSPHVDYATPAAALDAARDTRTLRELGPAEMAHALASACGHIPGDDYRVIADHARPDDTVDDLIEVVREARSDAALEREGEAAP